jgi:hypothetical protein
MLEGNEGKLHLNDTAVILSSSTVAKLYIVSPDLAFKTHFFNVTIHYTALNHVALSINTTYSVTYMF